MAMPTVPVDTTTKFNLIRPAPAFAVLWLNWTDSLFENILNC